MRKYEQRPELMDDILARSKDVLLLLEKKKVSDDPSTVYTDSLEVAAFRRFTLYLDIDSTGTPTDLRIEIQFLEPQGSRWHTYKQGPFASLYWEDTDTASGIQECFSGECTGRVFRLKLTCSGGSSSDYFTVSAAVEFSN